MLSRQVAIFFIVLFWAGPIFCQPNPHEWAPTLRFDGSASKFCYPDKPSTENDGKCVTKFNPKAPVYWEGQRCSSNTYKLAYWFWYGRQKGCIVGDKGHGNDWEHITLNFTIDNNNKYKIHSVTFYQHKGYYTRKQESKNINVWIGKIGHGSYHNWCDGKGFLWEKDYCMGGCGYWDDFRNDKKGVRWKPTNLRPLNEAKRIPGAIGKRVKNEDYCAKGACKGKKARVLTTSGCWQNNATFYNHRSKPTSEYDKPLFFECSGSPLTSSLENSKAITSIKSHHSNKREDRVWTYGCSTLKGGATKCKWTGYVNKWDEPMDFTAPGNSFLGGFDSIHSNKREDRIWKLKLCTQKGKCRSACSWSSYVNKWDKKMNLLTKGKVIAGVKSEHSNKREDRRWRYLLCNLVDCK